jgi:uncharacterized protein
MSIQENLFIGRQDELKALKALQLKKTASLVVIKGRRRVGKSRLIEEFGKTHPFFELAGLAPFDTSNAQTQRDHFSKQLGQFGLPDIKATNWHDLFQLIANNETIKKGRCVLLLDEISWMADDDATFLPKLKHFWDVHFSRNPKLILVLCGSISSWIEKNILNSTAFFGRINLTLDLKALPLHDCNTLLNQINFTKSAREKLMILSVTGGIAWYLQNIDSHMSAEKNIHRLCFSKNGLLVNEYNAIFHDLFGRRGPIYKKITQALTNGPMEYAKLATAAKYNTSGQFSEYLDNLESAGFISRDHTWNIKQNKPSGKSRFRLSDNYLRFYLKYIDKNLTHIQKDQYKQIELGSLPAWNSIMGFQFENLILSNRDLIIQKLGISPADIVNDNPYYQTHTTKTKACQIDYLIQTRQNTLYACEFKFSNNDIGKGILKEMKTKIANLALPKGYACIPVLVHCSQVSDVVTDEQYFFEIIDFSEFLT